MPAEPLALLEVRASAGLCLLPDRYGYDYGSVRIEPSQSVTRRPPKVACEVHGPVSIPRAVPRVVSRLGLDLHSVDLSSGQEVAWLETLVWPGQNERAERLRGAIIRGDLLTDLEPLIAVAPRNATLVVFHTAVLAYVRSSTNRRRLAEVVRASRAVWISNEAAGVFPSFADKAPTSPSPERFLMAIDGEPVAWTGPHGQSLDWFGH
jgi:hypothetical protein